ncbi:hypothetical protein CsSME_00026635 [Camellia sinensis var. sinensis]
MTTWIDYDTLAPQSICHRSPSSSSRDGGSQANLHIDKLARKTGQTQANLQTSLEIQLQPTVSCLMCETHGTKSHHDTPTRAHE